MKSSDPNVKDIILYIRQKFGNKAADAVKVAKCESGFKSNAKNSESSAKGIFQIVDGTWIANRKRMGRDASLELKSNWIENVDTAEFIYEKSNWWPWLASNNCHGLLANKNE